MIAILEINKELKNENKENPRKYVLALCVTYTKHLTLTINTATAYEHCLYNVLYSECFNSISSNKLSCVQSVC